jgi:DNA-binding transcriptional LysR family regulator
MIFLEVADSNSMSLAAEKLYMSQQGVSKSIMDLEKNLNMKLFKRTKNGVFLTASGEKIYPEVKGIIELYNKITTNSYIPDITQSKELSGRLILHVAIPLVPLVTKLAESLSKNHPKIQITLDEHHSLYFYNNIQNINTEICFTLIMPGQIERFVKTNQNYNIYLLKENKISLFAHKSSPLANRKKISVKELDNLPFICHGSVYETKCFTSELFESNGIKFNPVFSSAQLSQCLSYLQKGNAYYLSDSFLMDFTLHEDIISIPIKENIVHYHTMLTLKERNLSDEGLEFVKIVQTYFQNSIRQIRVQ